MAEGTTMMGNGEIVAIMVIRSVLLSMVLVHIVILQIYRYILYYYT